MRILFVNPRSFLPQLLGGVETTTYDLALQLGQFGHPTAVMCQIEKRGTLWLRNRLANRLTGRAFPADRYRGVTVYRGYEHDRGLGEVARRFRAEVLVIAGGSRQSFDLVPPCLASGLPTRFYFHELIELRREPQPQRLASVPLIANSHYTATALRELIGREAMVAPPLVDPAAYRVVPGTHVTMINPRRLKGGEIALALARACPEVPFLFVEAWHPDEYVQQMRAETATLANVSWQQPTTDMRAVYARTRLVLAPSVVEETWGRVVTEAQASGIPALASRLAALPESVGPGGVLVAPDAPLSAWVEALRALWNDPVRYAALSESARVFAAREEAQPPQRIAAFVAALG